MRIPKTLAVLAATVFFAGSAMAQDQMAQPAAPAAAAPADKPPPPTPEEITQAAAVADGVIQRLGIGDIFVNDTTDKIPVIRHKASSMPCWVGAATNSDQVKIFDGLPRGDDVGCTDNILDITRSLYATRYPKTPTADMIVNASVIAMKQLGFKKLKPYSGPGISLGADNMDMPKVFTYRFTATFGGQKVFTRTSAVVIGDWVYAQRVTAPEENAMAAELMAELQWVELMISLSGKTL